MSIKFGWFDVPLNGDPTKYSYSADEMRLLWKSMLTNGIVPNIRKTENDTIMPEQQLGNSLMATPGQDLNVVINEGIGWIDGAYCIVTEPETILLQAGWINDIVLRLDLTGSEVFMGVITKRRSAATIERGLIREGGIYELGLHSVNVPVNATQITQAMIIDYRLNMRAGTDGKPCCGIVGSLLMPDIDEWHQSAIKKMNEFLQSTANSLDDFTVEQKEKFNIWFLTLQGVLSGDIAGNLANQVLHKQDKTDNTLKTTSKEIVGAINELSLFKQYKTDNALRTKDKTVVGGINEVNDKANTLNSDIIAHRDTKSIHGSNINYNSNATYDNGIYFLTLDNAPLILPTNYTINFIAPANVKYGAKVVLINPNKYLYNKYEKTLLNGEFTKSVGSICTTSDGYINLKTIIGDRIAAIESNTKAKDVLKPKTDYTLILDIKNKRDDSWLYVNVLSNKSPLFTEEVHVESKGIIKLKLTTRNVIDNANLFFFRHVSVNDKVQYDCEFKAWLVEGDYTNKDIKITDKDELILVSDYEEYPILSFGEDSLPIEDNEFIKGQPITLNVGSTGAFFKSGGGNNKLPSSWVLKAEGKAIEPIQKHDAVIRYKVNGIYDKMNRIEVETLPEGKTANFFATILCDENGTVITDGRYLYRINDKNKITMIHYSDSLYQITLPYKSGYLGAYNSTMYQVSFNIMTYYFDKDQKLKLNSKFGVYDPFGHQVSIKGYLSENSNYLFIWANDSKRSYKSQIYNIVSWGDKDEDKAEFKGVSFKYSEDSFYGCCTSYDDRFALIHLSSGVKLFSLSGSELKEIEIDVPPTGFGKGRLFSHNNKMFVSCGGTSGLSLYKTNDDKKWFKMPNPDVPLPSSSEYSFAFTRDDTFLIATYNTGCSVYKILGDKIIKTGGTIDIQDGEEIRSMGLDEERNILYVGIKQKDEYVSRLKAYQLDEEIGIRKLNSVCLDQSLIKDKKSEFGIGIARHDADTNQRCKVTLIKGINDHLGGIYA